MKFSDFINQLQVEQTLGLRVEKTNFTPEKTVSLVEPSAVLIGSLERAALWPSESELALREILISPLLSEVYLHFKEKLTFFSSENLTFEPDPEKPVAGELSLWGVCDYIIGGRPRMSRIQAPILSVVEAKRENFESGTAQCAAELYACRLVNLRAGKNIAVYYGAVTTGYAWRFVRLQDDILTREGTTYALQNLPQLLGVWRWILNKQIESLEQK